MKLKLVVALISSAFLNLSLMIPFANACTGLRLIAADGGVVIGRTMEFGFDVESDAFIVPAGTDINSSLSKSSPGMSYTSKYGIVGANALGKKVIVDGVNEAGLYVGSFYFPGYASYAEYTPQQAERSLAPEDYGAWLLANFGSVAEVKENYGKVILVPNPLEEIGGISAPLHFVVHDATGSSIVIEPIDGKLKIYENPLGVMANSPTFDWHITNLRNYINLTATNVPPVDASGIELAQFGQGTGLRGLPGDFTPPSRFVRAVAFSQLAEKLATAAKTVPQVFHLMNAFDIPVGAVRDVHEDETHYDYTVWTSVSDLTNRSWAIKTYTDQSIRSIDVATALSAAGDKVQVIELDSEQSIIDISTEFE